MDVSDEHRQDPLKVAHAVLDAYRAKNFKRLAQLTPTPKRTELPSAIEKDYRSWRAQAVVQWDGKEPGKVRYDPRTGDALVRFATTSSGRNVAVRLMRRPNGWTFGKLISIDQKEFASFPTTVESLRKAAATRRNIRRKLRRNATDRKKAMQRETVLEKTAAAVRLQLSDAELAAKNAKTDAKKHAAAKRADSLAKRYRELSKRLLQMKMKRIEEQQRDAKIRRGR